MKVFPLFFIGILLFLAACQPGGNNAATATAAALDNQDLVATMVAQTLTAIQPTAPAIPSPTVTKLPPAACKDDFFGIQITLPNDTWTCKIEPFQDNTGATINEMISLQSPLFTIMISNLGRGPFCGDGTNQTGCVVDDYYKNQYVALKSYTTEGNLREIFGVMDRKTVINGAENLIWVSIKYKDMETRELTSSEKQELIQLLDSMTFK
jgi:hypothetical protein